MLLRRISEHVKAQNWTAVALDFLIVVIGVGVALAAGEWMNARAVKADLQRAETTIHAELYSNYLNALERIAFKECNAAQIRQLADRLKNTNDPWTPVEPFPNGGDISGALGAVIRAPYRGAWPTGAWKAAGDTGLLIHMDTERKDALSELFSVSETISGHQEDVIRKQSELKALMVASELSATDRLRYYDILGELDAASALIEVGAEAVVQGIERLDVSLTPEFERQFLEDFESRNRLGLEVYGECFKLMRLPNEGTTP